MDKNTLRASLDTLDGWKKINKKSMLFFGGGAKSFPKWQKASSKALCQNHLLAQFEHDDSQYFVYAFSNSGEVPAATLQALQQRARAVDQGTVRYESLSYMSLEKWRGNEGSTAADGSEITSLGDPQAGLFVYAIADDNGPFPWVAFAVVDGDTMIFPIAQRNLS